MKLEFVILFFLSQIVNSQNDKLDKLLINAEKAFKENNFQLAKDLYTEATSIAPNNKVCWFNLAASELNLGEKDNACEHFHKVRQLGDFNVLKEIRTYCNEIKNDSLKKENKSLIRFDEVEEKPKFIHEGIEYSLFENKVFHPTYLKLLEKALLKSKILKTKAKGKTLVTLQINKFGIFHCNVIRVGAETSNIVIVKNEIISIFRNLVTYIPAKHKGKNVDLLEKWTLPIDL